MRAAVNGVEPEDYSYEISYGMIEPPENEWIVKGGRCNGKTILSDSVTKYLKADEKITMETAKMYLEKSNLPKIKKVIFNYPATIIIWEDKSKTVVKLMEDDEWDPEKGFAMAYLKKILGTQRLRKEIKTWVKPQEKLEAEINFVALDDIKNQASSLGESLNRYLTQLFKPENKLTPEDKE